MEPCIFCKIAHGESPNYRVYEDEYTCVFMDTANDVEGHMIAIPKKHVNNILDSDSQTLYHLMQTVKKVSKHCVDTCGYDGFNLLNANDESAGQSIFHFHIHIIPRKKNDGIEAWPVFHGSSTEIEKAYQKLTFG